MTDDGVRYIPLTKGAVAKIDARDWPLVSAFRWYLHNGYAARTIGGRGRRMQVYMHRFIIGPALSQEIDHINGDPLDNRRANLRACSRRENATNKRVNRVRRNGQSRFKGVWRCGRAWRAEVRANGKRFGLGSFSNEVAAAKAYDVAAVQHHGEFARLNFPAMQSVTQPLL